ncbi:MAG TPA: hypothetical protein VIK01_01185 [Polyangiaceae bacterium]
MRTHTLCLLPILGLSFSSLTGCGDSQSAPSGLEEPVRIVGGQFIEGSFPASHDSGPQISTVNIHDLELLEGATGKSVTGLAGPGSQSVAIALQGLGHGYWVVPVGSEDLDAPGFFDWGASLSFSTNVPGPKPNLAFAAADSSGQFGPLTTQTLFVKSLVPMGHVVASLTWGVDADLDLHLIAPNGKELSPKHPNTISSDANGKPLAGSGLLDHDSLAACVPDGLRTENVVWADAPLAGTYGVYVDMFSACGKPAANFKFSLLVDGQSVLEKAGRLLDIDADGGASSGLFVTQFTCDEGTGTCS